MLDDAQSDSELLVLPITRDRVKDIIKSEKPQVSHLPAPDLASIFVLVKVVALKDKGKNAATRIVSKSLSELLKSTKTPSDLAQLRKVVADSFSKQSLEQGIEIAKSMGIGLATPDDFHNAQPTKADGSLNPDFSTTAISKRNPSSYFTHDNRVTKLGLNDPQGRAVNRIMAEPDEHLHIQGYPGAGKSHLIQTLTGILPAKSTLLLAMTKAQLDGLMSKVDIDGVVGRTFGHIASEIITENSAPGQWSPSRRFHPSYNVSNLDIAAHLGFRSVGGLSSAVVADSCRRAVMSFCYTPHSQIGFHHFPKIGVRLNNLDRQVLVEYANRFWEQTILPEKGTEYLPVRGYHQIKYAAQRGWGIPDHFSHVIVDESHDLTAPMTQILDQSNACTITLGDKFQRLEGISPERRPSIRRSELDLTMRAGREMEGVINPLIETHPLAEGEIPLRATDRVKTVCEYYDKPSIPEHPCTILVGGQWHLFEYFQRLSHEGVKFALLPGSASQFRSFSEDLIDLYHDGKRAKHSFLFRYPDWESLRSANQQIRAFQRIETMLQKGYNRQRLDESLMKITPLSKAKYLLGRVDDARNLEFHSVMLTPELLPSKNAAGNKGFLSSAISRLYVGASRAQNKIILPGYMKEYLNDF